MWPPPFLRSSAQKTTPTGSDAGRRLGSVVRHPACCFEWLGAQGTRPSSCPSHTRPFSPRSPLRAVRGMWSSTHAVHRGPCLEQGSGARQQLHQLSIKERKGGPWFRRCWFVGAPSRVEGGRSMLSPPGTRAVPSRSPTRRRPPGTRLPPRRRGRAPRSAAWCRQPLETPTASFWKAHTGSWRVESAAGWRLIENCSVQSGSRPLSLLKLKIKEPGPHQLALR